jgi:hypothetical protein
MDKLESLNHAVWDCKNHVVFIPKRHRKAQYGDLRRYLGEVFRKLDARDSVICVSASDPQGDLYDLSTASHTKLRTAPMIAIPPKYAVRKSVYARTAAFRAFVWPLWVACRPMVALELYGKYQPESRHSRSRGATVPYPRSRHSQSCTMICSKCSGRHPCLAAKNLDKVGSLVETQLVTHDAYR